MKLFRTTTTVKGMPEPMVDWYQADSVESARDLWLADCGYFGLPMDKTSVVFTEFDPVTLKPL